MSHEIEQKLLPIKKGDSFIIGPYHFVCMGWENGRILARRYENGYIYEHSLSIDVALDPGFRITGRASEVKS